MRRKRHTVSWSLLRCSSRTADRVGRRSFPGPEPVVLAPGGSLTSASSWRHRASCRGGHLEPTSTQMPRHSDAAAEAQPVRSLYKHVLTGSREWKFSPWPQSPVPARSPPGWRIVAGHDGGIERASVRPAGHFGRSQARRIRTSSTDDSYAKRALRTQGGECLGSLAWSQLSV